MPLSDDAQAQFAAQYTDQQSVGDDLLTGTDFAADQWGVKAELAWGGALFTPAYTSAGGDANMRNPVERLSGLHQRAGRGLQPRRRGRVDAARRLQLPVACKGLSVYGLWVDGSDPDDPGQFAQGRVRPQPAVDARRRAR